MLMKFVSFAFTFSLLVSASASVARAAERSKLDTRIVDVLAPQASGESYQVLSAQDGRVYEIDATDSGLVARVEKLRSSGTPVRMTLEGDRVVAADEITGVARAEYADSLEGAETSVLRGELGETSRDHLVAPHVNAAGYEVSALATVAEAATLFDGLESLSSKSQCYQRAHLWSLQMWNQRQIKSKKVFLFFTRRFIRQYRYKWWFHVAPFVSAAGQETVLDPTFTHGPLEMRAWTDSFVTSHAACPEVSTYAEYENNQEAQHCYTLKLPMYYYQPRDGEALDRGQVVASWRQWDINHAAGARRRRGRWPF